MEKAISRIEKATKILKKIDKEIMPRILHVTASLVILAYIVKYILHLFK
ncbi:MAG: hypothetical protein K2G25_00035 [Oscillospiraceae bacterium]|nr:hypothetical protein [Oscillospiraceae bacterium]